MKENSVDVWEAYLNTLENRGVSHSWDVPLAVQEKLTDYFKTKIDVGIIDGKTAFPSDFMWNEYVWRIPDEMREKLTVYAQQVLETDPDNGAAVKFLAMVRAGVSYDIPPDEFWDLYEKAVELLPNDVDICYLAFENASLDILHDEGVVALERLFERHRKGEEPTLYQWLYRCCYDYLHVTARPNDFYVELDSNAPLFKRWTAVLKQIQTVFEKHLERTPDHWHTVRMLTEIHETLGDTDAVQAVLKEAQPVFEKILDQEPDDWTALHALANIHEKFGNAELSRQYRIKKDPTLAWEEQILPDFPASTVDLDGNPISLMDYRGKVVLLDFWAVWCGPCVGEIPNVKEVYEKYHDKGFDVIGVSFDENESTVREFIEEKEIPWRQILDSGGFKGVFAEQYGVRGIPAPFLIDRNGKVISIKARGNLLGELVAAEIEGKKE